MKNVWHRLSSRITIGQSLIPCGRPASEIPKRGHDEASRDSCFARHRFRVRPIRDCPRPGAPRLLEQRQFDHPTAVPAWRLSFRASARRHRRMCRLTVAENRKAATPAERGSLSLAVGVFKARTPIPNAVPLGFLTGGPGEAALDEIAILWPEFAPLAEQRDLVVLDQR